MLNSEFPLDEDEPQEGNGGTRVPLSEAITAILDVLEECAGALRNASGEVGGQPGFPSRE